MKNNNFTISEFANMFNVSRQTLIYYDKIGIFKPEIVDGKNNYRLYSSKQIKTFLKIQQLKEMNISLNDIIQVIKYNDKDFTKKIIDNKLDEVEKSIDDLNATRLHLLNRKQYFNLNDEDFILHVPFIKEEKEVYAIFETIEDMEEYSIQDKIDYCYAKCIKDFNNMCKMPYVGIGACFKRDSVLNNKPFVNYKVMILVGDFCYKNEKVKRIDGGKYLCMYKYSMPDDPSDIYELLKYASENGYEIVGDIYDICIIDNYYTNRVNDLTCIKIPIK